MVCGSIGEDDDDYEDLEHGSPYDSFGAAASESRSPLLFGSKGLCEGLLASPITLVISALIAYACGALLHDDSKDCYSSKILKDPYCVKTASVALIMLMIFVLSAALNFKNACKPKEGNKVCP